MSSNLDRDGLSEKHEKNNDVALTKDVDAADGSPEYTTDVPKKTVAVDISEEVTDPVYHRKALILNDAIQQIGMGRYQWQLFVLVGFGWSQDNLYPIATSLILPAVTTEFQVARRPLLSLAQNIGLLAGAVFWGFGCDIFGRKHAFNLTIGITAIWALISASAPNFVAIGIFVCFWSFGVGGNLPVDSAVFLEFLPGSHQYLLTVLSIFWALAQVFATLIAWPLIGYRTCSITDTDCTKDENFGWRYFMIAMGGFSLLCFIARFFFFHLYESPKYLMGKGLDEQAVKVVHEVARRNGKQTSLTVEDLTSLGPIQGAGDASAAISRKLETVNLDHVRPLFATSKMAFSTSLIILIWAFIGLGFPLYNAFLPFIQQSRGAQFGDSSVNESYRDSLIIAVLGVPGAILGGLFVETPRIGRKGTLSISTILTGVFLFGSTTAVTSNGLLGWNCAYNFFANIMYAVLYSYTPEIFPTKDRGTGNALAAAANRVFGIMAPIVAMFANLQTAAPVYVSGALFIAAGALVLALPYESRGRASL